MNHGQYQLLPDLTYDEYQALKASIAERGILVPVELDELGNILDGHHRIRAHSQLRAEGIKIADYPRLIRTGLSEAEKRNHVRVVNLLRRHLSRESRDELLRQMRAEGATVEAIAEATGIPKSTVHGVVRGIELSETGKLPGKDGKPRPLAYKPRQPKPTPMVMVKDSREETRAIAAIAQAESLPDKPLDVKRVERIAREQTAAALRAEPVEDVPPSEGSADIRHGDFRVALSALEAGSVDLILTDPPYLKDYLDVWEHLSAFAARVLKPGGVLLTYTGQYHLPQVMTGLGSNMEYIWTIALLGRGPKTIIHARHIYSAWKPVLVYAQPPYKATRWADDLFAGAGPEKGLHDWQQAYDEAAHLVTAFCDAGSLVVDPFCGSGTVGLAAVKCNCRFIGSDVDAAAVRTARTRVHGEAGEVRDKGPDVLGMAT